MSPKRTKETYHKSNYYWDFTRNMSPKDIEKSQALMGQDMGGFLPRREEI